MSITHINSLSQLNGILSKSKDKLTVIDFHATWCGPCRAIAPAYEALSKKYTNVNFLKCDVDATRDVAQAYSVSAMPTFIFLKGSNQVAQVRGADRAALERTLSQHSSGSSNGAFTGTGHTLGKSSSSETPAYQGDSAGIFAAFNNLDPQVKLLIYLVGGYLLFWYLS